MYEKASKMQSIVGSFSFFPIPFAQQFSLVALPSVCDMTESLCMVCNTPS
jgi:hypothetical protein